MATQIDLLKKYGLQIKGHLGQHLLIDPNLQRKIVDLLDAEAGEKILEIGPGLGAITGEMLSRGYQVCAVEKDPRFLEVLKTEYSSFIPGYLNLTEGDVLKTDLKKIIAEKNQKKKFKVISNLPYYITAPILFQLLSYHGLFSRGVFMVQKEVAQRMVASPGTKDYGRLTLGIRYAATVKHAFDIPPRCFTPQPEVESSVIVMEFHTEKQLLSAEEEEKVFRLIKAAFSQRRKTFLNLLLRESSIKKKRPELEEIFKSLGWSLTIRGEELLLKDYIGLAQRL